MEIVKRRIHTEKGITLVALVVTIVVLLILAGITLTYVLGDNSVFKQASEAKLKTDIANWQEKLEMAKNPVFIEGLGTFNLDKYFEYIEQQGIINNKDTDVIDNGDGTYDVTTKPGYVFLVTLMPTPEKPADAEIEYIGQKGKIAPIIKRLDVSATSNSITGRAVVARLGNGTVEYSYKISTESDSEYKKMNFISLEEGAKVDLTPVEGTTYVVKAVAQNDTGEHELIAKITIGLKVKQITLNKTSARVKPDSTLQLISTIIPSNAENKKLKWTSSNEEVATVDENGLVTAFIEGSVLITVETADGSGAKATCTVIVEKSSLAKLVGQPAKATNQTVYDDYGNKVVVPAGFSVVANGGTDEASKVDYKYSGDGDPNVQDGVVIEDNEGNQFVWIPVGTIKNEDDTITTITLGRYRFGTLSLEQDAKDYTNPITIDGYFQEIVGKAKDLGDFVNKTNSNSGYYLARYESSEGSDGKVDTQANKRAWASITQPNADKAAKEMYNSNFFESDLVNGYMWDTALVFIQEYSGNNNYANEAYKGSGNTGKVGDKVCNIYDMASNCLEWSTETNNKGICCARGGDPYVVTSTYYPASRGNNTNGPGLSMYNISFRVGLYIK